MFFLLRMAFWLGLVLVLLPREKTPESEKLPQIGASQAVQDRIKAQRAEAVSVAARTLPAAEHAALIAALDALDHLADELSR